MQVLNRHHLGDEWPPGAVYIGRASTLSLRLLVGYDRIDGTALGNPYKPGDFPDPAGCLDAYRRYLWRNLWSPARPGIMQALAAIRRLTDPVLVCSCAPNPCHGDVIAEDWTYLVDAVDEWEAGAS